MDHEEPLRRVVGSGVGFGPQRHPIARRGVDEHDGRIVVERCTEIGPRRQVRRVEIRHVCEQRRVGAEPVLTIPWSRVDDDTLRIDGERGFGKCHPVAARSGFVVDEVGVARERQDALARVERITAGRRRCERSLDRGDGRGVGRCGSELGCGGLLRRRGRRCRDVRRGHRISGGRIVSAGDWRDRGVDGVVPVPAARCDDERYGDAESDSFPHGTHGSQHRFATSDPEGTWGPGSYR